MDTEFVNGFFERWLAAWNTHEPDRLLALMTEDVVYDDSAWPHQMHGHTEVREFLESTWRAIPDLTFEVLAGPFPHPDEPQATVHWRGTGTFTGPLEPPGFAPTHSAVDFAGFDRHVYSDGLVSRLWVTFDMMDVSRQAGLLPKAGSRVEKAGAAAQRLGMRVRGYAAARAPSASNSSA